jgi:nicotinamide-nucleotide amidase
MNAWILAIGDELVRGITVDTNSAWVARELEKIGVRVLGFRVVGDGRQEIAEAIRAACAQARIVIATGGLGPTEDDRTRAAAAEAAGVPLRLDERSWTRIQDYLTGRNRPVPASNRLQAELPAGAVALDNDEGTAPGFRVDLGTSTLWVLPGPPREVMPMWEHQVLPALRRQSGVAGAIATRELHVLGPSEALAGERIADLMREGREPRVGITAHAGLLTIRIVAQAAALDAAERAVAAAADEVRARLQDDLVHEGEGPLPAAAARALLAADLTLATAESCTGGLLAAQLTAVAGISAVYRGGFVCYADAEKLRLGVRPETLAAHGAVSVEVAGELAASAARLTGARLGVSITGIAGPGGGSSAKPVGRVCFGLCADGETQSWQRRFPDLGRAWIRERSCIEASALLLRAARKLEGLKGR